MVVINTLWKIYIVAAATFCIVKEVFHDDKLKQSFYSLCNWPWPQRYQRIVSS